MQPLLVVEQELSPLPARVTQMRSLSPNTSVFLPMLATILETEEGETETHHHRRLQPSFKMPPDFWPLTLPEYGKNDALNPLPCSSVP